MSCIRAHVLPSACHCEPVRTLVWQSVTPQGNLASWQYLGRIRSSCVFAGKSCFSFGITARRTDCPVASLLAMTCRNMAGVRLGSYVVPWQSASPAQGVHCGNVLTNVTTPPPSACHCEPRPCTRSHAATFCMSLRTSAHTGVAIRVPAGKLSKLAILRANPQLLRIRRE